MSITASGAKGARTYTVRWRTPEGGSRQRSFGRKVDAERFESTVVVSKASGTYLDRSAGMVTVAAHAERWLGSNASRWAPSTRDLMMRHVHVHVLPRFGPRMVGDLGRVELRAWATELTSRAKPLAPSYATALVRTFSALLSAAVEDELIAKNPLAGVRVGSRRGARTSEQADPAKVGRIGAAVPALADAMPGRARAAVLLMAATGLRLGECTGLTLDRVDFLRRTLRADRQLCTLNGATSFGPPKTAAGVRTIPLPDAVVAVLAEHVRVHGVGDDGLLFTNAGGRPWLRQRWADTWARAVTACGLPGTRTHDLRHVCASALIGGGLSVEAVRAVLGHESAAETLGIYTHFWPSDEGRTRDAIGRTVAAWSSSECVANVLEAGS